MEKEKQNFRIELDRIELLNCINSLAFAINLISDEENNSENRNNSGYLIQLQEKLTKHLPQLSEEIDRLFIRKD